MRVLKQGGDLDLSPDCIAQSVSHRVCFGARVSAVKSHGGLRMRSHICAFANFCGPALELYTSASAYRL